MSEEGFWSTYRSMDDLTAAVVEELHEQVHHYFDGDMDSFIDDATSEVAAGLTPVYTADLMRLASENLTLATQVPELALGNDWRDVAAVDLVRWNVYEALYQVALDEAYAISAARRGREVV